MRNNILDCEVVLTAAQCTQATLWLQSRQGRAENGQIGNMVGRIKPILTTFQTHMQAYWKSGHRQTSNQKTKRTGYKRLMGKHWHEPGQPASEKTYGKFYTVHLMDATPEEKAIIESHLGLSFEFMDDGRVRWQKAQG